LPAATLACLLLDAFDAGAPVEVLDVEQYLGRAASPEDVRIGPDWETGTPARDLEILDIDDDGILDVRLRWSPGGLDGNGHLEPGPMRIWGKTRTTARYGGMDPVVRWCTEGRGSVRRLRRRVSFRGRTSHIAGAGPGSIR